MTLRNAPPHGRFPIVANHWIAPPTLLGKLSHSGDKTTRRNVALTANAPKEVLVRLAPQFPADFFGNPAFGSLLLEDPNLPFKIGGGC